MGDALTGVFGSLASAGNAFINDLVSGNMLADGAPSTLDKGALFLGSSPKAKSGSAVVMGAAADAENAYEGTFGPQLQAKLDNNPDLSIDEVLALMDEMVLDSPSTAQPVHHPTLVSFGDRWANQEAGEPKKLATFVANSDYDSQPDLLSIPDQAAALERSLMSRGYDILDVAPDQSAAQMSRVYNELVANAGAGDELFAYYGGHGCPMGLNGVRDSEEVCDIYSYQQVANVVDRATSKGAHIHFVMYSCNSGVGTQLIRTERLNALAEKSNSLGDRVYLFAAECALECKNRLLAHLASRTDRPDVLKPLYQDLEEQYTAVAEANGVVRANLQHMTPPPYAFSLLIGKALVKQLEALEKRKTELDARWKILDEDKAWQAWRESHDQNADHLWALLHPALEGAGLALGVGQPPRKIDDYKTLGAQMDFLDRLQNAAMRPVDEAHR